MNQRYYVSSVGNLFKKSLEMFADKLLDENGNEITAADMQINDKAFALFKSGTGITRTSVVRIE